MCESLWSHRLQHTRLTSVQISEVQSISRVWLSVTPWSAALQASISITNSQSLLKLISIESVMPSNHLIFCRPYLLPPSIFPRIRVFTNESVHHLRWPKYWSFSFSISPSSEYLGLISFRMDWLDLLAVQGTLKNLLQHHSSEASTLWKWKWKWSHSVMSNSLQPHGLYPTRLLCPWNSPDNNIGIGNLSLLQGIFSTQGLNPVLLYCRQILYHLSHWRLTGKYWDAGKDWRQKEKKVSEDEMVR